jgi:hypothetical protein
VFGFPKQSRDEVLKYFTKLGGYESHHFGEGNWVYLKYSTPEATTRALAMNTQVLPNGDMIGVKYSEETEIQQQQSIQPALVEEWYHGKYLRLRPRRLNSFFENFSAYVLNWE